VIFAIDEGQGLYTASNAASTASYDSPVFQLENPINAGHLIVRSATPGGTELRLQLRASSSKSALDQQPFAGPDGSPGTSYQGAMFPFWLGLNGKRYLQYRATLVAQSSVVAPRLEQVVLAPQGGAPLNFRITVPDASGSGLGANAQTAGKPFPLMVESHTARAGLPLNAWIELYAEDGAGNAVAIEPRSVKLKRGQGSIDVAFRQAVPSRACVRLGVSSGCSTLIDVHAAAPQRLRLWTDLQPPAPLWSVTAQTGQAFTMHAAVQDGWGNTLPSYLGTVSCALASPSSAKAQLPGPYSFSTADAGQHSFPAGATIDSPGEHNIVCSDVAQPSVAGQITVQAN
jgi:hypothetical protein